MKQEQKKILSKSTLFFLTLKKKKKKPRWQDGPKCTYLPTIEVFVCICVFRIMNIKETVNIENREINY